MTRNVLHCSGKSRISAKSTSSFSFNSLEETDSVHADDEMVESTFCVCKHYGCAHAGNLTLAWVKEEAHMEI